MSDILSDQFDREREMMKLMLGQGKLPTGNGTFMEVSPDTAERIKEEIDNGASFTTADVEEVQYDEPGGMG